MQGDCKEQGSAGHTISAICFLLAMWSGLVRNKCGKIRSVWRLWQVQGLPEWPVPPPGEEVFVSPDALDCINLHVFLSNAGVAGEVSHHTFAMVQGLQDVNMEEAFAGVRCSYSTTWNGIF